MTIEVRTMGLFKTVSGVARGALGDVKKFREVLEVNTQALPFQMPPQVSLGLEVLDRLDDLKVPTEGELKDIAIGKLQGVLQGLGAVTEVSPTEANTDGSGILDKITWLL